MFLTGIQLQHFRSYSSQHFKFEKQITFILGPNTAGKSNLIEAVNLLSFGKSFRAEKDLQMIAFGKDIGRVKGRVHEVSQVSKVSEVSKGEKTDLEVVLTTGLVHGEKAPLKKYLVNGVPRRRVDFAGNLVAVLFSPKDLDVILGSPGLRRDFLDTVLEQTDRSYRQAKIEYERGIRQRNALLEQARDIGRRNQKLFEYWDELVIRSGSYITEKRKEFIDYVNDTKKDIFDCVVVYDHSIISQARLEQYKEQEVSSAVTLVGPHRDDFSVLMKKGKLEIEVKQYASRGQQRLAILQLKMLQMEYIEKKLGYRPILLLDDIFSELDDTHIKLVVDMIQRQQTIISTTHHEFIRVGNLKNADIIKL